MRVAFFRPVVKKKRLVIFFFKKADCSGKRWAAGNTDTVTAAAVADADARHKQTKIGPCSAPENFSVTLLSC